MVLEPWGHAYPDARIGVAAFPGHLSEFFTQPAGLIEDPWPPTQINYLDFYLRRLECKTVLVEEHYIDRDYIDDLALFYTRSLRGYPNFCQRLHFFADSFDLKQWQELVEQANSGNWETANAHLQRSYLGFVVVRPLPGCPIGRTVLKTFPGTAIDHSERLFGGIRLYEAHIAGFHLALTGLAFQQQDRGVSACATTALWSALHKVAPLENLALPTPAAITQSASRYVLAGGRSLPSEGLTLHQICEAIRAAGLAPLLIPGVSPEQDKAQLLAYLRSGFPLVVAIQPIDKSEAHAVCAVGAKIGEMPPPTSDAIGFRDAASSLKGLYIHDDRLGPYALADLSPYTLTTPSGSVVRTGLLIRWPEPTVVPWESSWLMALIVPVPTKLRLTVTRMRTLGIPIAQWLATTIVPSAKDRVTLNCRYVSAPSYQKEAFSFGLSQEGTYRLVTNTPLSRYVGLIEFSTAGQPLLDIVLDATETTSNPSVLACVRRTAMPAAKTSSLEFLAKKLGAPYVV